MLNVEINISLVKGHVNGEHVTMTGSCEFQLNGFSIVHMYPAIFTEHLAVEGSFQLVD